MAISVTNKALIGGVSSVALGGLACGSYFLLTPFKTIKDTLLDKNKTPIDLDEKDEFLIALAQQYHSKSPTGKKEIEDFTLSSASDFTNFKNKCNELLNTPKNHKDFIKNLKHAENWCVKEASNVPVTKLLESKNRKSLTESDSTEWSQNWGKFKNDYKTVTPTDPWVITGWNSAKNSNDVPQAFKNNCNTNLAKVLLNTNHQLLTQIEKYCTKLGNS